MSIIRQPISHDITGATNMTTRWLIACGQFLPSALLGENSGALKILSFEVAMAITIPAMIMLWDAIHCSASTGSNCL